jgi:hypothetical protein
MLALFRSRLRERFGWTSPLPGALLTDLAGHSGQSEYRLDKRVVRIGRFPKARWILRNDIVLPYHTISRRHAELRFRNGAFYLRDLRSLNGTFRQYRRLKKGRAGETKLQDGDIIRFDEYEFRFSVVSNSVVTGRFPDWSGAFESCDGIPCSVHARVAAAARCPLCSKPFCSECLVVWAERRICMACRTYVICEASPQEIEQLLRLPAGPGGGQPDARTGR